MADKVTLTRIENIETSADDINDNYATIETAFDNTLSRDGSTPNSMSASLDMNSNSIINLPSPSSNSEPVTLGYLEANVSVSTPSVEFKSKVSSNDTTTGFLSEKLTTSDGLSFSIINGGGDEDFKISPVIAADSGLEEVVTGLQVKDAEGIAVDTNGVSIDFPSLTNLAGGSLDGADTIAVYDTSATEHKELTITDLAANLPTAPDASTTTKGIIEIADTTEEVDSTVADKAMTPSGVSNFAQQYLVAKYEVASGTAGQTFTASTYNKTNLNTLEINNITGASLSSSVVTLPAGTYIVEWEVITVGDNGVQTRLRNTSDGSTIMVGGSVSQVGNISLARSSEATLNSTGKGVFTIAASKNIELQTYINSVFAARAVTSGENEEYHRIMFTKVA